MPQILCTFPGRCGDLLWALPTVRAISEAVGAPVDLQIAGEFGGMVELLAQQPYLDRVYAHPEWHMDHGWAPPSREDVISPYDQVLHLGYRRWPEQPLPNEVWNQALVECAGVGIALQGVVPDLRPWISVEPNPLARPQTFPLVAGWTDCHFELKVGLCQLLSATYSKDVWPILCPPGSRWETELTGRGVYATGWVAAARYIQKARVFLGDCSALHVLAVALGKPCVLVEPMEARWNPIFYPLGMDGPAVRVVKGLDGRPTFDARHTADTLREVLGDAR